MADLNPPAEASDASLALASFHAGDRATLELCYRRHYAAVGRAAASVLAPADAETVTHEVFHRLLSNPKMRASFTGGDLGAWLSRVARNQALDFRRRYARETSLDEGLVEPADVGATEAASAQSDSLSAAIVIDRFRKTRLPPKWDAVFETRFLKQLGQREAAKALGMHRTTLMYQEHRIRALLRTFVLESEP